MKRVFMAAPVRGDVDGNLKRAEAWTRVLEERFDIVAIAPWIYGCRVWNEADEYERKMGIQRNKCSIKGCEALIAVGPNLTPGMMEEVQYAMGVGIPVYRLLEEDSELKVYSI